VIGLSAHKKRLRFGHRDNGILCRECEQVLGRYDAIGSEFCRRLGLDELVICRALVNGRQRVLNQVPFSSEGLLAFILSVVWRASVCSLDFFKAVSLGPLEKSVRDFILDTGRGSPPDRFDAVVGAYGDGASNQETAAVDPQEMRFSNVKFLKFYMGAFWVLLKVDRQPMPRFSRELSLRSNADAVLVLR